MTPPRTASAERAAREPQRRPGKERYAALLRAGAQVIAERGFEAATMAEIAQRAGAQVGSLYRFFPNKDALADALIQRYRDLIDEAFKRIDARPGALPLPEFADALLGVLSAARGETQAAVVALHDARPVGTHAAFSEASLRNIARTLRTRDPALTAEQAADMATVLLANMKMMKSLDPERDAGAIAELREMVRLYLVNRLRSA